MGKHMTLEEAVRECATGQQRRPMLGMLQSNYNDSQPPAVINFLEKRGYIINYVKCGTCLYGCYHLDAVKVVADAPAEESGR